MSRDVQAELAKVVAENKVVLFMKGNPNFPQCGFSAQVAGMLSELKVPYVGVNVLADPEVRSGIKQFSNWPTIPQLYIDKEFVGGCDIAVQMYESGELKKAVDAAMAE
ncbi:MAG: monothiol glutaredoxin [Myxococcota bacterium]|jgi:monothiol glutaredoxin